MKDFPFRKILSTILKIIGFLIFSTILLGIGFFAGFYLGGIVPYRTSQTQFNNYACNPPCTINQQGNITNIFTTVNGNVQSWTFPVSSYYEVTKAEGEKTALLQLCLSSSLFCTSDLLSLFPTIPLTLNNGTVINEISPIPYVTPNFFSETISTLTENRTDKQFVAEVFNFVNQTTTYSYDAAFFNDTDRTIEYPVQTLTTTVGVCRDFSVLAASMLEAGNEQANYGMKIYFVFTKLDLNTLQTAKVVPNHILIQVVFADGTSTYMETTSKAEMNPYNGYVNGWYISLQ